jgi:hypothetical protein
MPLSIAWRWKAPTIQAPKSYWERNNVGEGLEKAATAIGNGLQRKWTRERTEALDKMIAEDRQRRNDWEDRQRKTYGEVADTVRTLGARRAELVGRAEALRAEIARLKQQAGIQ